jgi:hypothetical protein
VDTANGTYLVECFWPGVTASALADAGIRAVAAAHELSTPGRDVRFLGSLLVPADETVFCRFAAGCVADVERASTLARLPFARILESIELPGDHDLLP